jgi:hypothetical protein
MENLRKKWRICGRNEEFVAAKMGAELKNEEEDGMLIYGLQFNEIII